MAAACGLSLNQVRKHFERSKSFPGYTNPTLIQQVLNDIGVTFTVTKELKTKELKDGIAYVQWEGPWLNPGTPRIARYRHTHWIAIKKGWVYDDSLEPTRWIRENEWRPWLEADIAGEYAGWHIWQHYAF